MKKPAMDPYIEKIKQEGFAKIEAAKGLDQGDYALDLLNDLDKLVGSEGETALKHYDEVIRAFTELNVQDAGIFSTTGSHLIRVGKLIPLLSHDTYKYNMQCILMAAAHNIDITEKVNIAWLYGEQLGKQLKHCFDMEFDHFDQKNWRVLVGHIFYTEKWDMLETLYDFDKCTVPEFLQVMKTARNVLTSDNTEKSLPYELPDAFG